MSDLEIYEFTLNTFKLTAWLLKNLHYSKGYHQDLRHAVSRTWNSLKYEEYSKNQIKVSLDIPEGFYYFQGIKTFMIYRQAHMFLLVQLDTITHRNITDLKQVKYVIYDASEMMKKHKIIILSILSVVIDQGVLDFDFLVARVKAIKRKYSILAISKARSQTFEVENVTSKVQHKMTFTCVKYMVFVQGIRSYADELNNGESYNMTYPRKPHTK